MRNIKEIAALILQPGIPLRRGTRQGNLAVYLMQTKWGRALRLLHPRFKAVCAEFPAGICILSDGKVTTCCHDPLGQNVFASLDTCSIEEAWRSAGKAVRNGLYAMPVCQECVGSTMTSVTSSAKQFQDWRTRAQGHPEFITIEIMAACNYGCCISPTLKQHRKVKPDLDLIFDRIRPFLPHIKQLRLFNYGEPLLHDGFGAFVARCRKESERLNLLLATNGMLMDEEYCGTFIAAQLDHIIVSVHGGPGTEDMLKYSKYGADYDKVMVNIERLLLMRRAAGASRPTVGLRAILFDWNDNDESMNRFRQDAQRLELRATGGDRTTDNYHWILDVGTQGRYSSRRFVPGSADLERLQKAGETEDSEQ